MTTKTPSSKLNWKFVAIVVAALLGAFISGVYAGTVPPFRGVFPLASNSSSSGVATVQSVSKSMVANQNITVPAAGDSVVFGNISTVGYHSATVFIHMKQTSCIGIYFNGYWKADTSFAGYATAGLTNIVFSSTPGSVAAVAPVAGGQL